MTTLEIQTRDMKENLANLRKDGYIPAVFYGKKTESTPIKILQKEFVKVWKKVGESGVITLVSPKDKVDVLIKNIDMHPINDVPVHADFYAFEKGKKIEVSVPVEFIGISPAIKDAGCNLIKVLHEINIFSDPQNIPHSIIVDVSSLAEIGSQILAKDLKLPAGVELLEEDDAVVVVAELPEEEVEEPTEQVDLSAIEVEKKGKKEEELEG
ncbi:MAG: 50S ribosomal protein L25 [Candidatus Paceibacterota bacterium]